MATSNEYLQFVLVEYAKHLCATQLNCDLVISDSNNFIDDNDDPYPNQISVLNIPTNTLEYVDILGGPQNAPYYIDKTLFLFNARKALRANDPSADENVIDASNTNSIRSTRT